MDWSKQTIFWLTLKIPFKKGRQVRVLNEFLHVFDYKNIHHWLHINKSHLKFKVVITYVKTAQSLQNLFNELNDSSLYQVGKKVKLGCELMLFLLEEAAILFQIFTRQLLA